MTPGLESAERIDVLVWVGSFDGQGVESCSALGLDAALGGSSLRTLVSLALARVLCRPWYRTKPSPCVEP